MDSRPRASVKVTWPTVQGAFKKAATVRVIQRFFKHDMATIDYYVETQVAKRYKAGTPVKIEWGFFPNQISTWYGTVLYIRPHLENERHVMRVTCIGASYQAKQITPRIEFGVAVEDFIALLATSSGLSIIRPHSTGRIPMLAQSLHETKFQCQVRHAKRLGYVYFVNQTTAHCYDPVDYVLAHTKSWPTLVYKYGRGNQFLGDIVTFTGLSGDQGGPDQIQRRVSLVGLLPESHSPFVVTSSGNPSHLASFSAAPQFDEFLYGQPVHSGADAQARVNGARASNRWVAKAHAHVWGNARIRQGSGVYISGVSVESDGLWVVGEAIHEITRENHPYQHKYFMELTLLRDSRENNLQTTQAGRPVRQEISSGDISVNPSPNDTVFTGSAWVSSRPRQLTA